MLGGGCRNIVRIFVKSFLSRFSGRNHCYTVMLPEIRSRVDVCGTITKALLWCGWATNMAGSPCA